KRMFASTLAKSVSTNAAPLSDNSSRNSRCLRAEAIMLASRYSYLELEELKEALLQRPAHQTVILTGRGCHRDLLELADTVTEMRPVKHAFDAGVKAQQGIDW
ncbi:cob(I)yrinic acid a,c-diamide adenosyltransferase, partial [Serratia sp. (in: enterobacteria)]|uniref:cob(I)yrinic acid a,c-diamide adenosyltransferase n=1 Tax=Serratia sp. (in: enterobacteria) TaxID=616 RepID=UPI003F3953BE